MSLNKEIYYETSCTKFSSSGVEHRQNKPPRRGAERWVFISHRTKALHSSVPSSCKMKLVQALLLSLISLCLASTLPASLTFHDKRVARIYRKLKGGAGLNGSKGKSKGPKGKGRAPKSSVVARQGERNRAKWEARIRKQRRISSVFEIKAFLESSIGE